MKLYQIIISYLEPTQAVITLPGDSQDDALERLKKEIEPQVQSLEIVQVIEVGEITGSDQVPERPEDSPETPEEQFAPLPDNVIVFPGSNLKH